MWPFRTEKRVYLDYASATPVLPAALEAYVRVSTQFGNPGSIHSDGVVAKAELEHARESVAETMACKPREIIFVSGGTEANNLALIGHARRLESLHRTLRGTHWIVSAIEHPSVLECFAEIERQGAEISHIEVDRAGRVRPEALAAALKKETVLVSIGWANHEIGIIQDVSALAHVIHEHEKRMHTVVIFHSDAGQAPLYRAPHVHTLGVDILTLDSGKLYGPRGIGALYVSNRTQLSPILFGGSQERGLRAGTENPALATGFAAALHEIGTDRSVEARRVESLRNELLSVLKKKITDLATNGSPERGVPHILNVSIPQVDCEYLTIALDQKGIAMATKSACREGEEKRSHVIDALQAEKWRAAHTIRISLGRETTRADIVRAATVFADLVLLYRAQKMV